MLNRKTIVLLGTSSLIFAAVVANAQLDDAARVPGGAAGGVGASARGLSDAQIGLEVQTTLSRDLEMNTVRSDVRNGVATLNGTVATEADKQRAEQLARRVEGVKRVRNALVIEKPLGQTSSQISGAASLSPDVAITSRLRADARLAQRDIDVRARNDVITLTGDVESVAEKETAGRIAAEAAAGAQVRNRLNVREKNDHK